MWTKVAAFLVVVQTGISLAVSGRVVCYYGSWSIYRLGDGKFDVSYIDPTLCTHVIYTFVGISEAGEIVILDRWNDIDLGGFKRVNDLRLRNPSLRTLVAIGGWNEGSPKYSRVVSNDVTRKAFVQNAVAFVRQHGFDGFDLDWEYPNGRGGVPTDKDNFSVLLRELREEFDKEGFLLTAAVSAAANKVDKSYHVPDLSRYLDFINVMTYDLHGSWDTFTGENAPLYPSSFDEIRNQTQLNVDACVRAWIERGAAPEKINLGIGVYGRSFTLEKPDDHGIGAPAFAPGVGGKYTQESGMLGYNEICEGIAAGIWTVQWNNEQKVPYAYHDNQWVGYDDPESVTIKVEYAKSLGLGGVMIWSVETDDFRGKCGQRYPILRTINSALDNVIPSEAPLPQSTVGPSSSSTEAAPPIPEGVCEKVGYARDPTDCAKFYYCFQTHGGFLPIEFNCSEGLYFDTDRHICNYAEFVECNQSK